MLEKKVSDFENLRVQLINDQKQKINKLKDEKKKLQRDKAEDLLKFNQEKEEKEHEIKLLKE